jgi:hypothetical protein
MKQSHATVSEIDGDTVAVDDNMTGSRDKGWSKSQNPWNSDSSQWNEDRIFHQLFSFFSSS